MRERSRSSSSSSRSSHSVKAEEYPEEPEEREESTTGFDKSRLGTKEFTGPNERGRARGTFVSASPARVSVAGQSEAGTAARAVLKAFCNGEACKSLVVDEPECDPCRPAAQTRLLGTQPGS